MRYNYPEKTVKVTYQLGLHNITTNEFTPSSELLEGLLIDGCASNPIHLTWLSNIGNWEHFVFLGEKDFGVSYENSKVAKRDTDRFYYDIEAYESRLVRSQMLTEQQAKDIATIKDAIQANILYVDLSQQKLMVNKSSWNFARDKQKLTEVQFDIEYANQKNIQNQ